jgi:hypothetical protein
MENTLQGNRPRDDADSLQEAAGALDEREAEISALRSGRTGHATQLSVVEERAKRLEQRARELQARESGTCMGSELNSPGAQVPAGHMPR